MTRNLGTPLRFKGPYRGLNNRDDKRAIGPAYAHDVRDVIIAAGGLAIESRPGYTVANTAASVPVGGYADHFNRTDVLTAYYRRETDPAEYPEEPPRPQRRGEATYDVVTYSVTFDYARGMWTPRYDDLNGIDYPRFMLSGNRVKGRSGYSEARMEHIHPLVFAAGKAYKVTFDFTVAGPTTALNTSATTIVAIRMFGNAINRYCDFGIRHDDSSQAEAYLNLHGTLTTATTDPLEGTINLRGVFERTAVMQCVATLYYGTNLSESLALPSAWTHEDIPIIPYVNGPSGETTYACEYGFDAITFNYDNSASRIYGLAHHQLTGAPLLFIRSLRSMWKLNGNSVTHISGLDTCQQVPAFAQAYEWMYTADGNKTMYRFDADEAAKVGLAAPSGLTLTTVAGGGLSGTYDYAVTLIDPWTSYESNPSNTARVCVDSQKVTLNLSEETHEPLGRMLGVYRRKVSDGEPFFRLVTYAALNAGATHVDNVADASVLNVLLRNNNDVPWGTPTLCCFHEQRMYYVFSEYPNRVYHSEFGLPESVPATNWRDYGGERGAEVKALASLYGMLIVFTGGGINAMLGDPEMGDTRQVVPGVGCVAHGSVVKIKNELYFAAEDGVYRFNGQTAVKLSDAIQGTWDGLERSRFQWMVATNDTRRGFYLLSVTRSGQSENDRILIYHYKLEGPQPGPWVVWHMEATAFARSDNPHTLYFGGSDGYVRLLGGADHAALDDNGTGITWYWKGGRLDAGCPGQLKRFHYLTPYVAPNAGEIDVGYLLDDSDTPTTSTMDTSSASLKKVRVGRRGKGLGAYFGGIASTYQTTIRGFGLDAEVLGRR